MAKTNITEFSNVASNNTDINNVNIDENCPASNLNNALRELMKALKDVDTGSQALTALSVAGSVTATTSLKTPLIEFTDGDNALTIADGGNVTANADLTVSGDIGVGDDLNLTSDSSKLTFGADSEIILEHAHNEGLKLQGSGTNTQLSLLSFHSTNGTIPDLRIGKSGSDTIGTFAETADGESIAQIRFTGVDSGGSSRSAGQITVIQEGSSTGSNVPANMRFATSGSERMRIDSSGNVGIGATPLSNRRLLTSWDTTGSFGFEVDVTPSSGQLYGQSIFFSGQSPDGSGSEFLRCRDNSTNRLIIFSDGDVDNHDNSYSGFSDLKLKEQIEDASSQWEDIKALTVRKFKFKTDVANGDSDAHWRLGVIAQEVETAGMNGLVKTNSDTVEGENGKLIDSGTTTKSVKYSILYMKAVKALQEAMTRIEILETENATQATQIADLISRITALENA